MPKEDTQFSSTNQPKGRGKSKKTIIIEAMKEQAYLGLPKNATNEDTEKAWFSHLVKTAVDMEHKDSGLCIRLITERGWSSLKPSSECVSFDFDPKAEPHVQANQVMDAVAKQIIPPDLGIAFVGGIKSMIEIEANTELKERIEKLEAMINGD